MPFNFKETTVAEVHRAMLAGEVTCRELVEYYLGRIDAYDQKGPCLNAIILVNPKALKEKGLTGPLHGIPVILKDNVDTADMPTTAGSESLRGFTPDEEIGEGASLFDIPGFGADFAYTVDGGDVGGIEYENFNAASATVTIHGFSVHPGSAKNAMKNAQNIAIEFHNALPYYDRPEYTENREGFYHLCSMEGDVTGAKLGYIVRDHSAESFAARKETMRHIAKLLNEKYGEGTVELELKDSYFSMLEKIKPHFHLVENARAAIRKAGLAPLETPIRGGTDGATLSYMGLPCPNLGTGGFNYHGPCEGITVEAMDKATEILLNLADIYKDVQ